MALERTSTTSATIHNYYTHVDAWSMPRFRLQHLRRVSAQVHYADTHYGLVPPSAMVL